MSDIDIMAIAQVEASDRVAIKNYVAAMWLFYSRRFKDFERCGLADYLRRL